MKIGFIGFGNMGQAIARGMLSCGGVDGCAALGEAL